MSLYDYKVSKEIAAEDYPFYALIMAAVRQADSDNIEKLHTAFPLVYEELQLRYNAPAGLLPEEVEKYKGAREEYYTEDYIDF